ncbi:FMN reductase [Pseudonocardia sp. Ae168_Ps1]|uniref:NAD(P)H-dependent oxidoreductase n=1 Tax=unclassified Pseudonocardia TaxID=2619320 RepID=UPI0001FFEDBA|nr:MULTISPECIES: NAD(P)H-dependent oxidoreductase [unclassified Pseudonocardia]ALE73959.1 NADPH-dependent FMN reductase [Pseudonocardia sp. EC080625-04]ALL77360.1 NADPH-dependent FMN reductase [Pseudonocardia sp. EC080610-09]ALL80275.1 NADPH-dependent FMN reductase [Pseudonocardia sp. EC080619-01]OLL71039.1 FMN reductase [Pseudonocardia sp. Ae168_Ps1]OLL77411.1 FMN reductase [Pseudonocardia sp. Ae150A_Ps1]
MSTIIGVVAGPEPGGRTATAVAGLLAGAEKAGDSTRLIELSETSHDEVTAAFADADAVVFGSPVYRAGHTASLRALLEATERGKWGEKTAPLQGKAAAVVLTGASGHHFLAVDDLRSVLAGFFAVQVLSPGLYLDHSGYVDRNTLTPESAELAAAHGRALADLTAAVRSSEALRAVTPVV